MLSDFSLSPVTLQSLSKYYEKALVAQIKSNLLLNIEMYNMTSLQFIHLKTD
jgi:hypothetical protein